MLKKVVSIMITFVLVFIVGICGFASDDSFVIDNADILNDEEEALLDEKAREIAENYDCPAYVITVPTLEGYEAWEYNEKLYDELTLGYNGNAVVLMLAMSERKYDIMAHGYGNIAFTDYGKDVMAERFLDDFADDNWYSGFCDYLDTCSEFLEDAKYGEVFDVSSENGETVVSILNVRNIEFKFIGIAVILVISCVIALVICLLLRAQMKTAKMATAAENYAKELVLTNHYDRFSHKNRTRVYNPPSNSSSGGGTSVNSGGFSHKSGSF